MQEVIKLLNCFIGAGFGAFVVQKLFEHKLSKKLHQFTKLYSDKVDILRILYKQLVQAEKGIEILMSQREPEDREKKIEYGKNTLDPINSFIRTYEENEIILENELVEQFSLIVITLKKAKEIHIKASLLEDERPSKEWENAVNNKQQLNKKLEHYFPNLRKKLKKEIQNRYNIINS